MLISCTTKGCMKSTEAKLDRTTKEVLCEECGNPINGITPFMKKSLESVSQVLRSKAKEPFQSLCKNCNAIRPLSVKGEKAFCKICDIQVHISSAFLEGLKVYLANKEKE